MNVTEILLIAAVTCLALLWLYDFSILNTKITKTTNMVSELKLGFLGYVKVQSDMETLLKNAEKSFTSTIGGMDERLKKAETTFTSTIGEVHRYVAEFYIKGERIELAFSNDDESYYAFRDNCHKEIPKNLEGKKADQFRIYRMELMQ
jgi:hypothetical protein